MQILKEANGQWSFIRVAGAFILFIAGIAYLITSIQQGKMVDINNTQVGAVLLPIVLKVIQKFGEGKPIEISPKDIAVEISKHFKTRK